MRPVRDDQDLRLSDLENIIDRASAYSMYLQNYVNEYDRRVRSQLRMKRVLFISTLVLLTILILGSVVCTVILLQRSRTQISDVITTITALVGAITSFLVLPKTIAKNLFPANEDDKSTELFASMFEYDVRLREMYTSQLMEQANESDSIDDALRDI